MTDTPRPEGADELARLTAADPEVGTPNPDLGEVRAHVMAQAADTPQRRRSMLLAAGVAAAVALLAGTTIAGVAIGRNTAPVVAAADATTQQPVRESVPMVGPGRGSSNIPGAMQSAMGAPQDSRTSMAANGTVASGKVAADSAYMPYWGGYGAQVFVAGDGVSTTSPGTATGYLIDAKGVDRMALAATLANTFGVKGQPVDDGYGNITVGSNDGSGPQIWVSNDSLVSWSYYNPRIDPWANCVYSDPMPMEKTVDGSAVAVPEVAGSGAAVSGSTGADATDSGSGTAASTDPQPPQKSSCDEPTGPDAGDSQKQAEQILSTLGIAKSDVDWESSVQGPVTTVAAWQLIDGMRSQLTWSLSFTDKGLQSAYGTAAGVTPIEGYPVVSAKEAIDRSADPQWRAFGPTPDWGTVFPMAADAMAKGAADSSTPAPAPTLDGRPVVQVPVVTTTLSGGDAALVQYWQMDGTLVLLPGFQFSDADGGRWNVISVAESAVDFSTN